MRLVTLGLEECEFKNTCNNDKNLSEIQLEHKREDELVVVVVKVVHELDYRMVVKEIKDEFLKEIEGSLDGGLSKTLMVRVKMVMRRNSVLVVDFELWWVWFRVRRTSRKKGLSKLFSGIWTPDAPSTWPKTALNSPTTNVTISRVYFVEQLGHNLFSVGQFCDSDLEVGISHETSVACSPQQNGVIERRIRNHDIEVAHMGNDPSFGMPIPEVDSDQSSSTDEAPNFIIKFLKMIQVRLKVPFRHIQTDNGTEFVNQTLREYYELVGISHETSVARSPQQNGVVERRNRTLIEAACTMLIYAQAPLFLWAEAVATACYTQNRSIIRLNTARNDMRFFIINYLIYHSFMYLVHSAIQLMTVRT
nr:integrase, catalytic region, zinc finger, CCHC-type, peptidase aspartic, catalytic [Tanacetum cinerariifolium]